jgi:hypothetical protein
MSECAYWVYHGLHLLLIFIHVMPVRRFAMAIHILSYIQCMYTWDMLLHKGMEHQQWGSSHRIREGPWFARMTRFFWIEI